MVHFNITTPKGFNPYKKCLRCGKNSMRKVWTNFNVSTKTAQVTWECRACGRQLTQFRPATAKEIEAETARLAAEAEAKAAREREEAERAARERAEWDRQVAINMALIQRERAARDD